MTELFTLLFVFAWILFVLAIWAGTGHLIWEMAAWLFRQIFQRKQAGPTAQPVFGLRTWHCINCKSEATFDRHTCHNCGTSRPTTTTLELLKDLASTERQLNRFLQAGCISIDTFDDLQPAIRQEQQKLRTKPAAGPVYSVFLLLSIVTMIWYASANLGWTWLWYVAGIMTGATIIFMFAVFEKKRADVLQVVEGLREWER